VKPSVLVKVKSGTAVTGVSSVSLLSPGVGSGPLLPSSPILTPLLMALTPAAKGLSTCTANIKLPLSPALKVAKLRVQILPALLFGVQTQPALLLPGTKVL